MDVGVIGGQFVTERVALRTSMAGFRRKLRRFDGLLSSREV